MYKQDLAFNNQQWLKYNKTKPNQFAQSADTVEYTDCFSAEG